MICPPLAARVLPFGTPSGARTGSVGTVHHDGAITFRGKTYRTIRDVPPECVVFRADLASIVRWRALYRAVDPALRTSARRRT
ncbi:MAG: hypothetical protein ACHQM4_08620 [Thermoanaerobaculia bacterium]